MTLGNGELTSRLEALDTAVETLGHHVTELASALNTVNDLDAQQQEINRQLPVALADARKALNEKKELAAQIEASRKRIEELALNIIPKDEQARIKKQQEDNRRFIRRYVVYPATATLIAVLSVMGYSLHDNGKTVTRLANDEKATAQHNYESCLARNQQALQQQKSAGVVVPLLTDLIAALPPSQAKAKVEIDITHLLSLGGTPTKQVVCVKPSR